MKRKIVVLKFNILWLPIWWVMALPVQAQRMPQSANSSPEGIQDERSPQGITMTQQAGPVLGSIINPDHYRVGPSDVIAVNIWQSPPLNFSLTVTPEGTLIVPIIGEVPVAGMSLTDARVKITGTIRKQYLSAPITVTLVRPRSVIVSVLGNVYYPGSYDLSAVSRVNGAISRANFLQTGEQPQLNRQNVSLDEMSLRMVMVHHADGTDERADLEKFLATKDDRWNPYLREGDVIAVPRRDTRKNVFGIYGEVNAPGRYEYVEGDSLMDAVRIAQGFTERAVLDSVVFSRLDAGSSVLSSRIISLQETKDENVPLQPGDRIVVPGSSDIRQDFRVTVTGEVQKPGTYPITRNSTTLSEIIREAGGFTDAASLATSRIKRQSVSPDQLNTERMYSLRGATTPEDSVDFAVETDLRLNAELVNADFIRLFTQHDTTADVVLRSEDTVFVPALTPTVYVFGQVVAPGHIQIVAGKDYQYYIDRAGGLTDRARKGDIRVVKGRTRQWLEPDQTTIEGGDLLWIPKNPDHPFEYYMNIAAQSASVLSVIIGVTVLIIQARK